MGQRRSPRTRAALWAALAAFLLASPAGCGGGGGDKNATATTPAETNVSAGQFAADTQTRCASAGRVTGPITRVRRAETRRYAARALSVARGRIAALRSVNAPPPERPGVRALAQAYDGLAAAYAQLALPARPDATPPHRFVAVTARLERAVQRTAVAAGLPACGPLG